MIKKLKLIIFLLIVSIFLFGGISYAALSATFMLMDGATDQPLSNRSISIYEGAKTTNFDYDNKENELFISDVTTNKKGVFTFKLDDIKAKSLMLQLGEPFGLYKIGRTSDTKKSFTADGIWITNFDPKGNLLSNQFYNLKTRRVKLYTPPLNLAGEEKFSLIEITIFPKNISRK